MPTYILLIKWTEEGIKTVQDAPNRVERAHSMWKSAGGALKDFYFTFGRYDMIAIAEAPSDEAAEGAKMLRSDNTTRKNCMGDKTLDRLRMGRG